MKKHIKFIIIIQFLSNIIVAQTPINYSSLKGPYLGQKPPGMTPEIFAPGIISKAGFHLHSCLTFSHDGKEIYFTRRIYKPEIHDEICVIKWNGNSWMQPEIVPFSNKYNNDSPVFTPDGKRLFFCSDRPNEKKNKDLNFWYVERNSNGWGNPIYAGDGINSDSADFRLYFHQNGSVYLSSNRNNSFDIFHSHFINNQFSIPKPIDTSINTPFTEQIGFVAPDESYLVYYRYCKDRPEETGLYISFRNKNETWTQGKNMGEMFNDPAKYCTQAASLSPDGKYLFFLKRYEEAVYWVSSKIIEELKPKELK